MKAIFKNGQTTPVKTGIFLKKLGCGRADFSPKQILLFFLVDVPSIDVLADHNAVDAYVPHHGRAMPAGFEFVVNLLSLLLERSMVRRL
ncbi:hypothetical protein [Paenibacillus sp. LPE1-1-1.1]|uniref:hypothetical protein n=1 Tax=Paenibacillus sp. LPE1-1-1.1 TaxID=3135230 RepID=UPI003431CC79